MESEVLHAILGLQHIDENADALKIFEPLYLNVSDFRDVEFCFAFFCSLPSFKLIFKLLLSVLSPLREQQLIRQLKRGAAAFA